MSGIGRRGWFFLSLGAVCVPLVAAAVAYGCTAAATLTPSSPAASVGSTVTVTGKYFATHSDAPTSAGPVQLRLGSVTGPVLATVEPTGPDRGFTVDITVPSSATPGDSFLSATQFEADGRPVYGTPARQAFRVLPAPAAQGPGSTSGGGQLVGQVLPQPVATLSLATARRLARARVKRSKRGAKNIRAKCARRNATTAVCRVKYRLKGKTRTKRLVVTASSSSSAAW